jgi:hypothetical protein
MAKQAKILKANRDMLYAMAAISSFGDKTQIVINFDSWNPKDGTFVFAMDIRDNAPEQRLKDRHENGWAYYEVGPGGHPKPLTEDELAERS